MEKINTQEAANLVFEKGIELAEASRINVKEADFTIVQPYDDRNAIIITVEDDEEGERTVIVKVSDAVVILEKQSGTLDVFK